MLTIVVGAVLLLGVGIYAITKTDAFAKIAGQEFRSTKPEFVTGDSVVRQRIHMELKDGPTGMKVGAHSTVISNLKPNRLTFSIEENELAIPAILSGQKKTIKLTPQLVTIKSGLFDVEEIPRSELSPELMETVELMGFPIVSVATGPDAFADPVSEFADSKKNQKARTLAGLAVFLNPPFASNVDWWDVERHWITDSGGDFSGDLRFEKVSINADKVSVSITGTMKSNASMTFGNLTLATSTAEVSGEQIFSTDVHQWVGGQLKITIEGYANGNDGQRGTLEMPFTFLIDGTVLNEAEYSEISVAQNQSDTQDDWQQQGSSRALRDSLSIAPFYPSGPDWEIPVPPAKAPVLANNYRAQGTFPSETMNSQKLQKTADQLKSMEAYAEAETQYKAAIQADPKNAMAMYQLACCYELWGKPDDALQSFLQACDNGFNDFPTASTDSELGSIRQTRQFPTQLQTIRERYLTAASSKAGTPLVTIPTGRPPLEGWPVIFLLHGYGDTNEAYLDLAKIWSDLGFVSVALPGSIPRSSGGFIWSEESSEVTHLQIQLGLKSLPPSARVNQKQIHLMGFSQGALHSFQAAKRYPELYRGVVALSPGGSPIEFRSAETARPPRRKYPLNVWFAYGRQEPLKPVIDLLEEISHVQGWKTKTTIHNGGHTFPDNLMELLPQIAEFIKQ